MFRILVNTLSITNPSGMHVLSGHLEQIAADTRSSVRMTVLCRATMTELKRKLESRVDWYPCPENTTHWMTRAWWEWCNLPHITRDIGANAYFTPSGIAAHGLKVPQLVLCQNPWALITSARRRRDFLKAWLQRRAYRRAMKVAEVMVFNSRFMQEAYRKNAGVRERSGVIVYQAADDETRKRAASAELIPRKKSQIACVSVMGPHKNVEAVVRAVAMLKQRGQTDISLLLVGSWPDRAYQKYIHDLVRSLKLYSNVEFPGFLSREALDRCYAESMAFCLMSRCESFGIPAIEAQLFGTPVVSSNVCAIPEVCGEGGRYLDPDDISGIADALQSLMENQIEWESLSRAALTNSVRYSWEQCSKPLKRLFEELASNERP